MNKFLASIYPFIICVIALSSLPAQGQNNPTPEDQITLLEEQYETADSESTLFEIDKLLQSENDLDSIDLAKLYLLKGKVFDKKDQLQYSNQSLQNAYAYLPAKDTLSQLAGNILYLRGFILHDLRQGDEAVHVLQKCLEIRKKYAEQNPTALANTYYHLARAYTRRVTTYEKTVIYADSAIQLYETIENPPSEWMRTHMIKGLAQDGMNELRASLKSYRKAQELAARFPNDLKALTNLYLNLGNYYIRIDDDVLSELNYNKALNISLEVNGEKHFKTNSIRGNLATVKSNLKKFDEALKISKEILATNISLYGELDEDVAFSYNNLANIYSTMEEDETALTYFKKAEAIYQQVLEPISFDMAVNYLQLGESYNRIKKYEEALDCYDKTLNIVEQILGPDHILNAACHYYKASVLTNVGKYEEALEGYEITKRKLGYKDDDWSLVKSKSKAADLFFSIAQNYSYWHEASGEKKYLDLAKDNNDKALDLMWTARNEFESKESGDLLMSKYRRSFQNTLLTLMQLDVSVNEELANDMFSLIDAVKSNQLKDAILTKKAIHFDHVPKEIKDKESDINAQIYYIENELNTVLREKADSVKHIAQLETDLSKAKLRHNELMKSISLNHSSYFNLKYDQQNATMQMVQKELLQENEMLINYFIDRNYLFAIGVYRNGYVTDSLSIEPEFNAELSQYLDVLKFGNQSDFSEQARYLYSSLLGNLIDKIETPIEGLIIIPEGKLCFLPFEALMIDDRTFVNEKYHIRYGYSAKILLQQRNHSEAQEQRILAIAPEYENANPHPEDEYFTVLVRSGEYALPGSLKEVQNINSILPTTLLTKEDATESHFKSKAPNHKVLHLSMHGLVDEKYPLDSRLIFGSSEDAEDGLLHAYELYSMNLNADLAVLSACSTGEGKLEIGEGVQSLNRAFTFAGVNSTVMSLWKVPDASTEIIMSAFYENLKDGMTKGKALQKAKKTYLENEVIPERRHPNYWAGFILAGSDDPIEFTSELNFYYLLIPALLIGFFFFFKKNKPIR
ncbi:MAG: CHAT domain-containing protein [Bacteroidota bacterium]